MHLQSHKFQLNRLLSKKEVQRPSQRSSESLLTDAQIVFEHTSLITSGQILSLQRPPDTCYWLCHFTCSPQPDSSPCAQAFASCRVLSDSLYTVHSVPPNGILGEWCKSTNAETSGTRHNHLCLCVELGLRRLQCRVLWALNMRIIRA